MTRRIVVTGGCGYIGSHVARAFKNIGNEVYIIDQVRRDHTLKDIDGWFIGDFASDAGLSTVVDIQPDVVVHCAGTSLVGPSIDNPSGYWDNNVVKLIKLMDVIASLPKRPLMLFSSSASVYGSPDRLPIPENHKIDPISPYGNTKATCERIFKDYYTAYAIPSVCFRFFNAAGAEPIHGDLGQEPNATHIVARVLESAMRKERFQLNGSVFGTADGTCVRDYIHVWDLARAHVMASEAAGEPHGWVGANILNLGTGTGISNLEIIKYVQDHIAPDLDYITVSPRLGDPAELVAKCDKAKDWLGWTPEYSNINTIIDSAYKWYSTRV
jgi:UDP-glucose-4-epimerase GalE